MTVFLSRSHLYIFHTTRSQINIRKRRKCCPSSLPIMADLYNSGPTCNARESTHVRLARPDQPFSHIPTTFNTQKYVLKTLFINKINDSSIKKRSKKHTTRPLTSVRQRLIRQTDEDKKKKINKMAVRVVAVFSRISNLFPVLRDRFSTLKFINVDPEKKDVCDELNSADVVIADTDIVAPYAYKLTNIKWLQGTWAGVEPILKVYDKEKGPPPYPIVRFSGEHFGRIMSEYVVANVVAFDRDSRKTWDAQKEKNWDTSGKIHDYKTIADMTVTILGIGSIGSYVAKVLKCFGARVFGLVRSMPDSKSQHVDKYILLNDIDWACEKSDLIVNILPNTDATKGLFDLERFSKCKNALFVNIGRGSITSEKFLVEALEKEFLRGAILDVFPEEPLSPSSLLWNNPKVIITPHVAGTSRAKDIAEQFETNLRLWETERKLPNRVDFSRGY